MTETIEPRPGLRVFGPRHDVGGVVLLLHGGRERDITRVTPYQLAYLRMVPFALALRRRAAAQGIGVWLLRNRYRGWNAPAAHPVEDARWALEEVRRVHGDVPVVLVGHSMGGRVALRVAGDESVVAVCALAPWTPPGEPVEQLAGRTLVIAHGDQDETTDPRLSYRYAERAAQVTDRVARFDVAGEGHAMLREAAKWTALVTGFSLGALGAEPFGAALESALRAPAPDGLRVPLG